MSPSTQRGFNETIHGVAPSFYLNRFYSFNYSLFKVENEYVNGSWYKDENDVGSVLGVTVGSNFARNHGISLRLSGSGGRPYSAIKKTGINSNYEYDTAQGYYTENLDPIVSANLRYQFTLNQKWGTVTGYIELWNMFDQKPVAQRFFNPSIGYSDMLLSGIIPIGGVKVSF